MISYVTKHLYDEIAAKTSNSSPRTNLKKDKNITESASPSSLSRSRSRSLPLFTSFTASPSLLNTHVALKPDTLVA